MGFFQGTQGRVRNSCGKRAISVQAIEGVLYNDCWISIKVIALRMAIEFWPF